MFKGEMFISHENISRNYYSLRLDHFSLPQATLSRSLKNAGLALL